MKCGILGHREIKNKEMLEYQLFKVFEKLITIYDVDTFLFGSNSEFDDLCWKVINTLKSKYTEIQLWNYYCGREQPILKENKIANKKYYDKAIKPQTAINAGRKLYIERNKALIDDSDIVLFYYNEKYKPANTASGTKIAYNYAKSKSIKIINVYI